PSHPRQSKVARSAGLDSIDLEPSPDILASVVAREEKPFVVGFAAETGDIDRAVEKAKKKDVDLLVYNDVSEPGSGFGTDTNRVVVIDPEGGTDSWPILAKTEVAARLLDRVMQEIGPER
ncbi:MAG: phosphopantothenoylcysteine decarboxylase, partial [Acidimicrobiia bacterium]